jgi:5-methylcytosine-specific restriction protein A
MTRSLKDKQQANGRTLALDGAAWRKLRAAVLSSEPLCEHCSKRGLIVVATDVDHIDEDPSNNDRDNLASLCHSCHSHKTMASMGHNVYMGCDVNGMPIDPSHPWNKEKSPATDSHKPTGYPSFFANSNELPK